MSPAKRYHLSTSPTEVGRPVVHQAAPTLEEITAGVGRLGGVLYRMGERGLGHFAGVFVRSAAQSRKLDRNPCGTAAMPSSLVNLGSVTVESGFQPGESDTWSARQLARRDGRPPAAATQEGPLTMTPHTKQPRLVERIAEAGSVAGRGCSTSPQDRPDALHFLVTHCRWLGEPPPRRSDCVSPRRATGPLGLKARSGPARARGWPRRPAPSPRVPRSLAGSYLSVSNSLSGRHWELDQVPAVGDLTDIVQLGTGRLNPGCSEKIGNSRRTPPSNCFVAYSDPTLRK